MDYLVIVLAILAIAISLIHRNMVKRIYESDGRALSTFTLPRIIRREYKQRFGEDRLYWSSRLLPVFFLVGVIGGVIAIFTGRM
jgi:hypothetical protein